MHWTHLRYRAVDCNDDDDNAIDGNDNDVDIGDAVFVAYFPPAILESKSARGRV